MSERWTPVYDRLFRPDHELAGDQACRRFAWMDLCHMASFRHGNRIINGVLVPLERGELVVSVRFLGDRWGWSRSKVARFLALLIDPGVGKIVPLRETPVGTVYRVANYDRYAVDQNADVTPDETPTGPTPSQARDRRVTKYNREYQVTESSTTAGAGEDPLAGFFEE